MNTLTQLMIQMLISLVVSLLPLLYLRPALRILLGASCTQGPKHDLWYRVLAIQMLGLPLLLVMAFANTTSLETMLRSSLGYALLGVCAGVLVCSRVVWRTVVEPQLGQSRHSVDV